MLPADLLFSVIGVIDPSTDSGGSVMAKSYYQVKKRQKELAKKKKKEEKRQRKLDIKAEVPEGIEKEPVSEEK